MARGYGDCNAMTSDIGDGLLWQKIRCEARTSDLGDGELWRENYGRGNDAMLITCSGSMKR